MPRETHKPHSELSALIRSLADGETESEPLALAAVDRLFEQYGTARAALERIQVFAEGMDEGFVWLKEVCREALDG